MIPQNENNQSLIDALMPEDMEASEAGKKKKSGSKSAMPMQPMMNPKSMKKMMGKGGSGTMKGK